VLALAVWEAPALAQSWEQIDSEAGIVVYKKEVSESGVDVLRGVGVVDAPLPKVLWVLLDYQHGEHWIDRLVRTRVLERRSPHEFVVYRAFKSPPLVSDRDVVYENKATRDPKTGVVTVSAVSVSHEAAPPSVGVRAKIVKGFYRLTPVAGGATRVEIEALFDPMGALPAWIVNWVQRTWPVNTMKALRREVRKPHVKPYPLP